MQKAAITKQKSKISSKAEGGDSASRLIDGRIKELNDWWGETLALVVERRHPR